MSPIRVVVVDDQTMVRTGIAALLALDAGIEVVGQAANGWEAIEICRYTRPDLVLMDIRMPEMDGVEATRRIVALGSGARVLVLTTFDLDDLVNAALRAGASGFILKDAEPDVLIHAVKVVATGESLLAPSITRRLIERHLAETDPIVSEESRRAVAQLSDREREVLALIARGMSNVEIATAMVVAETTVKTHVGHIFMKLPARDRAQAIVTAYDSGLVRPGQVADR